MKGRSQEFRELTEAAVAGRQGGTLPEGSLGSQRLDSHVRLRQCQQELVPGTSSVPEGVPS